MNEREFKKELEKRGYGICGKCSRIKPLTTGDSFYRVRGKYVWHCEECETEGL